MSTFKPLKNKTKEALPEPPSSWGSLTSGEKQLIEKFDQIIRFLVRKEIDSRLAYLLWEMRWVHPLDYGAQLDEHGLPTGPTREEELEATFKKVVAIAFHERDSSFFEQLSYVLQQWANDATGVPSDIRFRIGIFYARCNTHPTLGELTKFVNDSLKRDLDTRDSQDSQLPWDDRPKRDSFRKALVSPQDIRGYLKRHNLPYQEGRKSSSSSDGVPTDSHE